MPKPTQVVWLVFFLGWMLGTVVLEVIQVTITLLQAETVQ